MFRKVINSSIILVFLLAGFAPAAQSVQAEEPWPSFHIVSDGYACGANWPIGVSVTLTIDTDTDHDNGIVLEETKLTVPAGWNPSVGEVCFNFNAGEVEPGMYASMTDGVTFKDTWIVDLYFGSVAPDGYASGTGPQNRSGHVCLDWGSECIPITVSSGGDWNATFNDYDPEFTDLNDAHVLIWDNDGDETVAYLDLPEPVKPSRFLVYPETEIVEGSRFPMGEQVTLVIDDDDDPTNDPLFTTTGIVGGAPWDSSFPWISFDLTEFNVDIQPGHTVIMFTEDILKIHDVQELSITAIDPEADTVSGTAALGAEIMLRVDWNPGTDIFVTAEDGSWVGDFSGIADLGPGSYVIAGIYDEDGDETVVDRTLPPLPTFEIQPDHGWVCTGGWEADVPITLTIDGSPISTFSYQDLQNTGSDGDFCFDLYDEAEQILPGMYVSVSDGTTSKDTLIKEMSFDSVNQFAVASGTALYPGEGHACLGLGDEFLCQDIAVETTDEWFADFGPDDPDLNNLTEGHVVISDLDGDATRADLYFEPVPYIEARLPADAVAIDLGQDVHTVLLEVYSSPDDPEPKCFDEFPYGGEGEVLLDCWHTLIFPGDIIELYVNGESAPTKVHKVVDISLDVFDPGAGLFEGTLLDDVPTAWLTYCNPGPDGWCGDQEILVGTGTEWVVTFGPDTVDPQAWFAAFAADEDGDLTMASLTPTPYISFNTTYNWLNINHFPPDSPVVVEIFTDDTEEDLVLTETLYTDGYGQFGWDVMTELLPGNYIIASHVEDQITRELAVENFSFEFIDYELNQAGGSADENTQINFGIMGPDLYLGGFVFAGSDGWVIDFWPDYEIDLTEDMDLWVFIEEEDGDQILADLYVPPMPAFTVQPDHGWVCTGGWQIGEWLTLTIAVDADFDNIVLEDYKQTEKSDWDESVGALCFDFYDKADQVLPGQYVRVAGDDITKKTRILYLTFDPIDPETYLASGSGGGDGHVYLEMDDKTWFNREIFWTSTTSWGADFSDYLSMLELDRLVEAHVVVWDDDGDETMAHLDVEDPLQSMFGFNPEQEIINAVDWPMGTVLTLEVDNPATSGVDYTDSGKVTEYAPWNPEDTLYVFDTSGYPILPGYLIKIYGSDIYKQTMVTSLTIDTVDYGNKRVLGSTGSDSFVDVWALGPSPEFYTVLSDQDGYWDVSFSKDMLGFDYILFIEHDGDGDTTELLYFPNSPPVAEDDSYLIDEDNILSESAPGVLSNDSDPENGTLFAILVSDVQHGTLVLNSDGSFSYTPDQDYFGPDSFSYNASDGERDSQEALVILTVNAINDPPTALDDSYSLDEDTVFSEVTAGVLANDSDPEGSSLSAVLVSGPQHGVLVLNPDGSFSYSPAQDYFGSDSFSYVANDGEKDSLEAVVSLTVNAVNDPPEVSAGPDVTLNEGQIYTGSGFFSDPDLDTWTASVDYYSDGTPVQDLPLSLEKTFALSNDYLHDDGVFTLTVTVDDGTVQSSDSLEITINNVAPGVEITSLADGKDTVLTGLEVGLVVSFTDPGDDTHAAVIDWGDGSQSIDPALSPFAVSHVYQAAGIYPITVSVADDDGGVGSTAASLRVVDPAEAAQTAIEELESILSDPELDPEIADALEDAIVELEGANDGASNGGAIDKIDGGQWNAALVKIAKAIQDLEEAEGADPTLDFSATKEMLALTAKSVALEVIELAEAAASKPKELAKVQQAYELIAQGQAALASGDYLGAVDKFREAVQSL